LFALGAAVAELATLGTLVPLLAMLAGGRMPPAPLVGAFLPRTPLGLVLLFAGMVLATALVRLALTAAIQRGVLCVGHAINSSIQRRLLDAKGTRSVDSFHKELGSIMWEDCGMARSAEGLKTALTQIRALKEQYYKDVRVTGEGEEPNQALEKAGRVADFFELAELMCVDALHLEESAGGHFRAE
jgi:succinate dehydrogenase/fumarate reductase flavoprotein subunit